MYKNSQGGLFYLCLIINVKLIAGCQASLFAAYKTASERERIFPQGEQLFSC